jgi:hypothetical protein
MTWLDRFPVSMAERAVRLQTHSKAQLGAESYIHIVPVLCRPPAMLFSF